MQRFWILFLLAASLPASAAERWHTVAFGESVSGIAKHYYGDFSYTELVLGFNERKGAELKPGERLRIPYCVDHRVVSGDNGSSLAKRYLGRVSAWGAIARLNGVAPEAPLRPGQKLTMPVVLRHALARGESLSGVAGKYYDDPGRAALLQAFNGISDPRDLAVGQVIEVPVVGLRLAGPKVAATSKPSEPETLARSKPPQPQAETDAETGTPEPAAAVLPEPRPEPVEPEMPAWFAEDFSSAERAYRRGDYRSAHKRVGALIERIDAIGRAEERARVWKLAAFLDVAFDRGERACSSFASIKSTGVPLEFDPDVVSPKIRDALAACDPQ